jgi:hypothetical protein
MRRYSPPFRRTITLDNRGDEVIARVADNVHDFTVAIRFDEERVTDVAAEAARFPWTTCPGGIDKLKQLVGTSLAKQSRVSVDHAWQCTHMLDLAKMAIAHAGRGGSRSYLVAVDAMTDPDGCLAKIARDGEELFEWHVLRDRVLSPSIFNGHVISGRASWSREVQEDDDILEAALILRRSLLVFRGRRRATALVRNASELRYMTGACLSFQPDQVLHAVRPDGYVDLE